MPPRVPRTRSPPASPPPSTIVAAPPSLSPAARPDRTCSTHSPRPTSGGTSSASGRSTSGWRRTVIRRATPTSSPMCRATHHLMPVTAADLVAAAADYAAGLPDRFDVVHLGMGPDGHTASWPPGDPVIDSAKAVDLSQPYQDHVRMTLTPAVVERGDGARRPHHRCRQGLGRGALAGGRRCWPADRPGQRRRHDRRARRRRGRRSSRQPDERLTRRREARRRLLDDASSAVGDARRAHAAAAQR